MNTRAINLVLILLLATAGILAWSIRKDQSRPNFEIMPDMARSVPYDSFSQAEAFPDAKTMQQPAPRTIPRGFRPFAYEATEEDAIRAGEELTNPYSGEDVEEARQGGRVYLSFCLPCHGPKGAGDGAAVKRGFPAPPALSSPDSRALPDGRIFHLITRGQGNMPAHGAQISQEDRWRAVLHIRSLQRSAETNEQPQPASP